MNLALLILLIFGQTVVSAPAPPPAPKVVAAPATTVYTAAQSMSIPETGIWHVLATAKFDKTPQPFSYTFTLTLNGVPFGKATPAGMISGVPPPSLPRPGISNVSKVSTVYRSEMPSAKVGDVWGAQITSPVAPIAGSFVVTATYVSK